MNPLVPLARAIVAFLAFNHKAKSKKKKEAYRLQKALERKSNRTLLECALPQVIRHWPPTATRLSPENDCRASYTIGVPNAPPEQAMGLLLLLS